jgi:hypothetical protein
MEPQTQPPLCVDLDGSLIHGDLLHDHLLRFIRSKPHHLWRLPVWLASGRLRLKAALAEHAPAKPGQAPPPNQSLLDFLHKEQRKGRPVLLVTASHRDALHGIAGLFPFDEILASGEGINLKGEAKAEALVRRFGEKGFDYVGNSRADEAVWARSRRAYIVHRCPHRLRDWQERFKVERVFEPAPTAGWRDWTKALRLHQWAKNLLIAVPFLADHQFRTWHQIALFASAFAAMGLVASATYLWNDLLDLDFDRVHPSKSKRLAASGRVSLPHVAAVSLALTIAGFAAALWLKPIFALLLGGYVILTLAYSFYFKRVPLADIFALSFLYLSRVVAGVVVAETKVSFWLFSFTFLLFFSLAAVKRFVEVRQTERGAALIPGRGYRGDDLELLSELGIASGVA